MSIKEIMKKKKKKKDFRNSRIEENNSMPKAN